MIWKQPPSVQTKPLMQEQPPCLIEQTLTIFEKEMMNN